MVGIGLKQIELAKKGHLLLESTIKEIKEKNPNIQDKEIPDLIKLAAFPTLLATIQDKYPEITAHLKEKFSAMDKQDLQNLLLILLMIELSKT